MPTASPARGPAMRLGRWLAVLLLAGTLAACDSPQQKEAKYLERGKALHAQGDDARAMVELRNVLRLNPKNAEALYTIGLIHEAADRLPQAFAAYQAAAAEQPGLVAAQVHLGALALMGGQVDTAEAAATAIERAAPGNADGLALQGAVMIRRGDLERALETARAALAREPGHENAVAVVIGVLSARGRPDEALAFLDDSLVRAPKSASLRLLRIALLEQKGDAAGVVATFGELTALEPDNAGYRLALANFHQQRNELDAAEAVLRAAIAGGARTPQTTATLVGLIYRQKGLAPAEAELKALLARHPDDRSLQLLLADLYIQAEQADAATAVLEAIVRADPDSNPGDDARTRLAQLRLAAGDQAGAAQLADAVLARSAGHRGANLIKGVVALAANDADETIRRARTALREDAAWLPGLRLLVDGHLRKGETQLAAEALRAVLAVDPKDSDAAARLASLLTAEGDLDGALKAWDEVLAAAADPAPALEARAAIAIRQGDWLRAQGDIDRLAGLDGRAPAAAVLAGSLSLAQRDFEQGREWFLKAAALRPDATDPMLGVVNSYVAENRLDDALAWLGQRTEARPEDAVAWQLSGELLARAGRRDDAAAAFRQAIARQPSWLSPYRQLAGLLVTAGDIDAAAAVYEDALAAVPDATGLLLDQGTAYVVGGRPDDALRSFERALERDPKSDVAANNVAALIADYRHTDATALERGLELAGRFRASDNAFFLDTLGWLHYRKGDYPVALAFLERARAQSADGPQFRYHIGMALYRSGRKADALAELEKAVPEGADYPGIDEARATLAQIRVELAGTPAAAG